MLEVIRYIGSDTYVMKDFKNRITRVSDRHQATIFKPGEADKFIKNTIPKKKRNLIEIHSFKHTNLFLKGIDDESEYIQEAIEETIKEENINIVESNKNNLDDNVRNDNKEIKNDFLYALESEINDDSDVNESSNDLTLLNNNDFQLETPIKDNKESKYNSIDSYIEYDINEENKIDKLEQKWLDFLHNSDDFKYEIQQYKKKIPITLKIIEDEILDIRHYIELNNFNVVMGYKLAKLLQSKLKLRRKLKNTLELINIIYRDWFTELKTYNSFNVVKCRDNRTYVPRQLPDLFKENKIIKNLGDKKDEN